jgi:hypothetical protein
MAEQAKRKMTQQQRDGRHCRCATSDHVTMSNVHLKRHRRFEWRCGVRLAGGRCGVMLRALRAE